MLTLRVYAVYQQKKSVLLWLVPVWIAQLLMIVVFMVHTVPEVIPDVPVLIYGCGPGLSEAQLKEDIFLITIPSLVFDTTTFFLLFFALYRHAKVHPQFSIFNLILRDGCLYWLAVCCINLTWTIVGHTVEDELKYVSGLPSVTITVIFISRLTLNIRTHTPPIINEPSMPHYDAGHQIIIQLPPAL